jgi:hypothetical protein
MITVYSIFFALILFYIIRKIIDMAHAIERIERRIEEIQSDIKR